MWFWDPIWFTFINWQVHTAEILVRFEKEPRFYTICLEKDLLGDWTLVASNGSMRSKVGATRIMSFNSYESALIKFQEMAKTRYQHKYRAVKLACSNAAFIIVLLGLLLTDPPASITKRRTKAPFRKLARSKTTIPTDSPQLQFDF